MTDWRNAVVYQIWPRSFMDSNGDGIGDIRGIISKLDHIAALGCDLIWLSPVYASPNSDFGYDVSDYYSINPEFGTMADFDALVAAARERGLGIIMDFVPNHTSDRHPWFIDAKGDPGSKYRDYYFFRDGRDGGAPNNWLSFFGGSAWQRESADGQYYLTSFTPNQCDLNWDNPAVRREMAAALDFWLDRGVAGFRIDVVNVLKKAAGLPDCHPERRGLQFPQELICDLPETADYLRELSDRVFARRGCFTVGEGVLATPESVARYTAPPAGSLEMMFYFDLHMLGCGPLGKFDFRRLYRWSVDEFQAVLDRWQSALCASGGWVGNCLSNHDQPRQVSRFGDDKKYRVESARALCLLNMTLRGTPFIYQGEEFGMTNAPLPMADWRDCEALNVYKVLQSMMHVPAFIAERIVRRMSRDNARTPVQWTGGENGGFSAGEPWMPVNPNRAYINAEADAAAPDSVQAFYRETVAARKACPALVGGAYAPLPRSGSLVAYRRYDGDSSFSIYVNMSPRPVRVPEGDIALCTVSDPAPGRLGPWEARMYKDKIGEEEK